MFTYFILTIAVIILGIDGCNMYNKFIEKQRRKHTPVWIQLIEDGNLEAGLRMLGRLNAAQDKADGMRCDDKNCNICN